jgi:hypothetical protein
VSDTAKIVFKAAFFVSTALGLSLSIGSLPAQAAGCEDLIDLKIPATTIRIAQSIPAGDYTASDKLKYANMPAFCRVLASVKPAPDSDIEIEMWLPKDGWKGVFHGNGNGGFGGRWLPVGSRQESNEVTHPLSPIWERPPRLR